jgi:hypothetical protein
MDALHPVQQPQGKKFGKQATSGSTEVNSANPEHGSSIA